MGSLSYHHRGGDHPLIWATIDEHFRGVVDRGRDDLALVSVAEDVRLTFGELDTRIQEVARGLVALGIGPGDRVGVWSTNNVFDSLGGF